MFFPDLRICHLLLASSSPRPQLRDILFAAFWRIYPVYLLALLVTILATLIPSGYSIDWGNLLGNLLMLQDFGTGKPGVWVSTFGSNQPLWSLSYEWWFYMLFFPVYTKVPVRFQLSLVTAISLIGLLSYAYVPNQISLFLLYFILWWAGVEVARTFCTGVRPTICNQRHIVGVIAAFCVMLSVVTLLWTPHPSRFSFGLHPILEIRHFTAAFALLCSGLMLSQSAWKVLSKVLGGFKFLAPISYGLYVLHYPLAVESAYLNWIPGVLARITMGVIVTFAVAYLAEGVLQPIISRMTRRKV